MSDYLTLDKLDELINCYECDEAGYRTDEFLKAARYAVPRLVDEIKHLRTDNKRQRKLLDGYQICGICGALQLPGVMHYGTLGDDAGWVCKKCISDVKKEAHDE